MVSSIIDTMSHRRFETYLKAAGYDHKRAINLYIWNAKIGSSFHILIQAVEISLRNQINHALIAEFGQNWWNEDRFKTIIDRKQASDLDAVITRINRKKLALETD
jgi:Abi-like protein